MSSFTTQSPLYMHVDVLIKEKLLNDLIFKKLKIIEHFQEHIFWSLCFPASL